MVEMIKKVWDIDGLKRFVALLYWSVVSPSLPIIWPEGVPTNINKAYLVIGLLLSALGLGHAAVKKYINGKAVVEPVVPEEEKPIEPPAQ